MYKLNGEKVFILFLIFLSAGYLIGSLSFGPNARLLPLPISLFSLFLCVLAMFFKEDSFEAKHESLYREIKAILLILLFIVLIAFVGPSIGSGIFCMIYMLRKQNLNILKSFVISICVALFIYYIFYQFLQLTPDSNFQLLL